MVIGNKEDGILARCDAVCYIPCLWRTEWNILLWRGIGASEASMICDVNPGANLVGFNLIICIIILSNQLFLLSIHSQEEDFDDNSISFTCNNIAGCQLLCVNNALATIVEEMASSSTTDHITPAPFDIVFVDADLVLWTMWMHLRVMIVFWRKAGWYWWKMSCGKVSCWVRVGIILMVDSGEDLTEDEESLHKNLHLEACYQEA